jgi:hypothetical protein
MPDDRIEIVETEFTAYDRDIGVEGHYEMPSVLPSGQAYVPHNTDNPAAGNKHAIDFLPDFRQFREETLIISDMSKLIRVFIVSLQ